MSDDRLSLAAQIGGEDADEEIAPHRSFIYNLFKNYNNKIYSSKIDNFTFIWRVGGSVRDWNFERCENIDLNIKDKYISIDIGIPLKRWKYSSKNKLKKYIHDTLIEGMNLMIAELKIKKIDVEEDNLLKDINEIVETYMNEF